MTDLSWESVGGLPGTLLTLADTSGIAGTKIHGPRHTTHFVQACRHFINRPKFQLSIKDFLGTPTAAPGSPSNIQNSSNSNISGVQTDTTSTGSSNKSGEAKALNRPQESFKDSNLTVFPIVIQRGDEPKFSDDYLAMTANASHSTLIKSPSSPNRVNGTLENIIESTRVPLEKEGNKQDVQEENSERECFHNPRNYTQPPSFFAQHKSTSICCYAFHTPSMRGKFDVQKAKQLGIPPGSAYSALTRGESVVNSKGETILPSQVISPEIPGSVSDGKLLCTVIHGMLGCSCYKMSFRRVFGFSNGSEQMAELYQRNLLELCRDNLSHYSA